MLKNFIVIIATGLLSISALPPPPPPSPSISVPSNQRDDVNSMRLVWEELHSLRMSLQQLESRLRRVEFAPMMSPGGMKSPSIFRNAQGYFPSMPNPDETESMLVQVHHESRNENVESPIGGSSGSHYSNSPRSVQRFI